MEKIVFHKISPQDREWMTVKLREEQPETCEYTFVSNFVWRKTYSVEVAEYEGCGVIRYNRGKCAMYSFPFGNGDKKAVLTAIREMCRECGCRLSMYPITEKYRRQLIEWFPGEFLIMSDRGNADYVYLRNNLAELKGKKFHGKRNHIARFMDGGDWQYEPINDENIEECRRMHREWLSFKEDKWESGVAEETEALHEAFDYYKEFGLVGGLIRKSGKIVAFAMGEPLNKKTMVVHFEKAYPDMQGAYPMINQQFVINACADYEYVNREEDTGDMGLRKAKLSYYPDILQKKYTATESVVTFADESDFADIKILWKSCFKDDDSYIDFYLKNRFDNENMMVIRDRGKVVSMASFLPAALKQGGEWIDVRYVYAVATLPEYRGNGHASAIIKFAADTYKQTLVLQPAKEGLKAFYRELGFEEYFVADKWEINITETSEEILNQIKPIDAKEYKKIRDTKFDAEGYLCWDEQAIEYALAENEFCGGRAVKIITNNVNMSESCEDIILYREDKNVLRVVETTLNKENFEKVVLNLKDCDDEGIFFKPGKNNRNIKVVFENLGGMKKNVLTDSENNSEEHFGHIINGYLNLTLG